MSGIEMSWIVMCVCDPMCEAFAEMSESVRVTSLWCAVVDVNMGIRDCRFQGQANSVPYYIQ